jgi:DNA-binding transcriptional ArsR family regulator
MPIIFLSIFLKPKGCAYVQFATKQLHEMFTMKRDIFQAIADPTRRAILVMIASKTMTPNALAEQFGTSRQAVSKHIKILVECQLLKQEKVGREIYYHFDATKMIEIEQWLEQFKQHWENRFDQLEQVLINLNSNEDENKNKSFDGFFR